jgi:16S rRNA (uracil1498-N3)-methyltransferase
MFKHFYLHAPLQVGARLALPEALQTRLSRVLRLGEGAELGLFNGTQGLWRAQLLDAKAKHVEVLAQLHPQPTARGTTLVLGLPKREAWETALRQATELGVAAIQPLSTQFSQRDKFNAARAEGILIEAAEQCERLTLPTLLPLQPLEGWLKMLTTPCAWAYERGGSHPKPAGCVLVGPEGGFSPAEVAALEAHAQIHPFSLGPTILRTDTAVVAALTAVQLA